MPIFSIIIPIYNAEQYLSQCIDAVLSQSFLDFEVILVNDGSTDNSGMLCESIVQKDERVKVIHQENKGVSASRNVGLQHAKGEYVLFVDSDDYVETCYLETILKEIQNYDILFWGNIYHYEDGNITLHQPAVTSATDRHSVENVILGLKTNSDDFEYFGFTWDKVFRRDIIEREHIRFVEGLSYREDELFTADYCRSINSINVISTPLYHYRVLNSGLTAKCKNTIDVKRYTQKLERQLINWHLPALKNHEVYRYTNSLQRLFSEEKNIVRKWRYAKLINKIYKHNQQNQLIPKSRFFSLKEPFFSTAFFYLFISKKG